MQFLYKNAAGVERNVRLTPWEEAGLYIEGFCLDTHQVKTFLKFRVVQYIDDWASHLREPHPNPAEIEAHTNRFKTKTPDTAFKTEVCFTGFPSVQKSVLQAKAIEYGMQVVTDVTVNLRFLVVGPTRGPAKIQKARNKGLLILLEHEFQNLLETGELPDGDDSSL